MTYDTLGHINEDLRLINDEEWHAEYLESNILFWGNCALAIWKELKLCMDDELQLTFLQKKQLVHCLWQTVCYAKSMFKQRDLQRLVPAFKFKELENYLKKIWI